MLKLVSVLVCGSSSQTFELRMGNNSCSLHSESISSWQLVHWCFLSFPQSGFFFCQMMYLCSAAVSICENKKCCRVPDISACGNGSAFASCYLAFLHHDGLHLWRSAINLSLCLYLWRHVACELAKHIFSVFWEVYFLSSMFVRHDQPVLQRIRWPVVGLHWGSLTCRRLLLIQFRVRWPVDRLRLMFANLSSDFHFLHCFFGLLSLHLTLPIRLPAHIRHCKA